MGGTRPVAPTYCVVFARRIESECTGPRGRPEGQGKGVAREPLKVGLAGLGAVGLNVARRIEAGIPGLALTAVSVRDRDKAQRNLPQVGDRIPVVAAEALAETCDLVVECLPPAMFRTVA